MRQHYGILSYGIKDTCTSAAYQLSPTLLHVIGQEYCWLLFCIESLVCRCYGGRGGECTIGCLYRRVCTEEEGASEMCICVCMYMYMYACGEGERVTVKI